MSKSQCILLVGIALLVMAPPAARAEIVNGLLNYWSFDNTLVDQAQGLPGSASTVADDGVFDGANGTGGIAFAPGLLGMAIQQDGASGAAEDNGHVRIPQSVDTLQGGQSLSISAWVETEGFDTSWQAIVAHGEGNQYRLHRRGADSVAAYGGGSQDIPASAIGPDIGAGTGWHHIVAITENGVSTRLWVDGGLVQTGAAPTLVDTGNSSPPNPDLLIGANPQTGAQTREWFGKIDDVATWDRPLLPDEIAAIYQAGLAGTALAELLAGVVDLSVTKDDGVASATPGSLLTYTVAVSNAGPNDASGATVTDTFPPVLSGIDWTCDASAGSSCPAMGSGNLNETVDVLVGGTVTFTATATIDPLFVGDVVNTASVAPGPFQTDTDAMNDEQTDSTTVTSPAAVSATKTVSGFFRVRGTVVYTIVLTNASMTAQLDNPGDELVDVLPPELGLLSASATAGTVVADLPGNRVTWNGILPGGGSVQIEVTAEILSGNEGDVIANQGTVFFDADGDGVNEASAPTDDPGTPASGDPTALTLAPEIPVLDGIGLLLLALCLVGVGVVSVRRFA